MNVEAWREYQGLARLKMSHGGKSGRKKAYMKHFLVPWFSLGGSRGHSFKSTLTKPEIYSFRGTSLFEIEIGDSETAWNGVITGRDRSTKKQLWIRYFHVMTFDSTQQGQDNDPPHERFPMVPVQTPNRMFLDQDTKARAGFRLSLIGRSQ